MTHLEHFLRLTSRISAPFLDRILKALSTNKRINNFLKKLETKRLCNIDNLKRILIISDINIGDAIITQSFVFPLKNIFPDIEISYAYQHKAYHLIKANPYIDRHFPLFKSFGYPSKRDCKSLKKTIEKYDFDLIFNFCPYFSTNNFKSANSAVIFPIRFIANIIRAYASNNDKAQIVFQLNRFANELIEEFPSDIRFRDKPELDFSGNHLYATQQLYEKTKKLLEKLRIDSHAKKIFFNPDTASRYTFIPFKFQLELLKGILSQKNLTLLLSPGYIFKGIENKLLKKIPSRMRKKIVVIPRDIPIEAYPALIDDSDMFITGDTGPLHIAAARKVIVDSDNHFRNSTALVEIFGATSARIYGYDSFSDEYLSASQDAPSKTFEGFPRCKNLTCIDKIFKKCPEVNCFEGIDTEEVIEYIQNYLS
jgi:ADP-heptose:LPS heptosyltransferase